MLTNCVARAKLVYNKKLQAYKLLVAFNAHKTFKPDGSVKYTFPQQAKCAYVSGDLLAENIAAELASVMPSVYKTIRTNSVEFVE
jgi:hypothetical protein